MGAAGPASNPFGARARRDTEFAVVPHPEPDKCGGESGVLGSEVRLHAQDLSVPVLPFPDVVDDA